jgi:hypothetical protein
VHYEITLEAAKKWYQVGTPRFFEAVLLALGSAHLDDYPLSSYPRDLGGHPEFHFASGSTLDRNWRAVLSDPVDPFLAGCVIHQYQDWFSHWNEGYTDQTWGHGVDTVLAWTRDMRGAKSDFFLGYHYTSEGVRVKSPFDAHPANEVKDQLRSRYPGKNFDRLTQDELIDLYLREFTGPGSLKRGFFGYDTDLFFDFTTRDQLMMSMTNFLVGEFYKFSLGKCGMASDYDFPTDEEIIRVLATGDR